MQEVDQTTFDGMPIESRLLFFANLGFFFSMQVRGIYASGSTHSDGTLRAVNETMHRLFQCLKGLARGGRQSNAGGNCLKNASRCSERRWA